MPEGQALASDFAVIAIFTLVAIGFVAAVLTISQLIQPRRPKPEKLTTYECGERPIGQAWAQFHVRYYIFALIFVIFDIETIFIAPWAVRLQYYAQQGWGPYFFFEMLVFLLILVLGLVYAWRKGVLRWV